MRDHLLQVVSQADLASAGARKNLAREYLQHYMLRLLAELRATSDLDFFGGTALRLLHQLPRFSEDLDFSLADPDSASTFDAPRLFARLRDRLGAASYDVSVEAREQKTVVNALFGFSHIAAECGATRDPRAKLSVKLEIDTHPPTGARSETTLVQQFLPFTVRHHDLPSLFSGKLHALLTRSWPKGRDWFDLVWYLTVHRRLTPNRTLLGNALAQTGHDPGLARDWRRAVGERLEALDWRQVLDEMKPFVERPSDLDQLGAEQVRRLLEIE